MSEAAAVPKKPEAHEMGQPFDLDNRFTVPCSCGRRYTAPSPSGAIARWKKSSTCGPKEVRSDLPVSERIRVCGCNCSGPLPTKANGLFLSGHDARFKSTLARALTAGEKVRHPQTGLDEDPLVIADWLDERRGGGTFWHDKVSKGLKVPEPRTKTSRVQQPTALRGEARAAALIQALEARRPAPGQHGVYVSRDGATRTPARVVRRNDETTLAVQVLEGKMRGQQIIVPDGRFEKTR